MTTTNTIATLAAEANTFLYRDSETDRVLKKDGTPAWVVELCRTAHGELFPDDWRYEFIQDALNWLEEDGNDPDDYTADLDSLYPYTADRLKWLGTGYRMGYCDDALAEMGKPDSMNSLIAWGMAAELEEVFHLVRAALESRLEEIGEDEDEPEVVE